MHLPMETSVLPTPLTGLECCCVLLELQVAHFHLKNGSWLWQINWEADLSAAGMARSYGMMVNYR